MNTDELKAILVNSTAVGVKKGIKLTIMHMGVRVKDGTYIADDYNFCCIMVVS